jgi:serine protease Do
MFFTRTGSGKGIPPTQMFFVLCALFLFISGYAARAYADDSGISKQSVDVLTKTGQAMAEIAETVKPAIVNISTSRTVKVQQQMDPFFDDPFFRRFFGDQFRHRMPKEHKTASLGSGVIVSGDGYILTNNHVIKDADEIKVLLSDKKEYKGKVIGNDPKTEIAVIKIEASGLPTIKWGDANKLRVGEVVLAIGNPYGLNQTVTMGIVSAVGRANVGIAEYEDFIQTDAAINPGNSGGALVNVSGELVGINTAIFSTSGGYQGIGLAIPSNMARSVMESLLSKGKVIRGWLGVSVQSITADLAKQFDLKDEKGALIGDAIEDSPAEKAGIQKGDVVIEYEGKKIEEPYQLRNMVANTTPGKVVELKVIRGTRTITVKVTIGELPVEATKVSKAEYNNIMKGITVQELTPETVEKMNLPKRLRGVIVSDMDDDSPAIAQLAKGDIIQEINRKRITGTKDYENTVSGIKPGEDVLLHVFRNGSSIYIPLQGK